MKPFAKQSYFLITLITAAALNGCTLKSADKDKLLPDSGPTTAELIKGHSETLSKVYYGNDEYHHGQAILAAYSPNSSHSSRHVNELQRDFQQIPNPQIVAYVYPHLNDGELPIPGYYTIFNLYERNHYALSNEGYYEIR
ncbi:TIGR03751 family conjugal transfer lipoprotein [Suttonella indologenes]|uniref:Conjugative transfer region lipoprotein n=1 Tax=Suttonella indologenes TaxID=13276 RepID=A0A380MHQ6_9GAMM|nr:TIGR03751 family conjugal transfer lipoprotein [Suttonella indologenes]SUO90276.1 conjugative transfer region lipoprotein [Suttonella indologenes]